MMRMDHLVHRFTKAGLDLKILTAPPRNTTNSEVFQLDIRRRRPMDPHSEYFCIWPGSDDTQINVVAVDKRIRQLVLQVREETRDFWLDAPNASQYKHRHKADWKTAFLTDHKLRPNEIREVGTKVQILQRSPGAVRHFLMGVDERQLFIAQCPNAPTTVAQAHAGLKAPRVILGEEHERRGRARRQGEWFFLNVTEAEQEAIDAALARNLLEHKVPIGAATNDRFGTSRDARWLDGPRPHVADEAVILLPGGKVADSGWTREVFVRGKIRHPEHKTLVFR